MPEVFNNALKVVACSIAVSGCNSTVDTVSSRNADYLSDNGSVVSRAALPAGLDTRMEVFLTGYSFWDNTPPGSAAIARPVIRQRAGGTGTYQDPITVAVGHRKVGGSSRMDFPTGTRFYFPKIQKYGIVEDLCGDGPRPQNGPCHTGYQGQPWLDIYVGGRSISSARADSCMRSITGIQDTIMNPSPGLPVRPGEISLSTCASI